MDFLPGVGRDEDAAAGAGKVALLLSGSHNDLGTAIALRRLGYRVIMTGNVEGMPAQRYADEWIGLDYSDVPSVIALARDRRVDAVVACCNDVGVRTAACVAETLGLSGHDSCRVVNLLHDKDRFKEFAMREGLPVIPAACFADENAALDYLAKATFPVIVKPVDSCGGKGCCRVDSPTGAAVAVYTAFSFSPGHRVVIEPFVKGAQHGFCVFLLSGRVVAKCGNDEYGFHNPHRVEIDLFPADVPQRVEDALVAGVEYLAAKLSLVDGIFHLQYKVKDGRPCIIEVMRRILGNMYHVPGNLSTDIDWYYWQARAQCGLSLEAFPRSVRQHGFFAYKALMGRQVGVVESVRMPEAYGRHLIARYRTLSDGQRIVDPLNQFVGFDFLSFPSRELMQKTLLEEYCNDLVVTERDSHDAV